MNRPIAGKITIKNELYGRIVALQEFTLPDGTMDEFFFIESKSGSPVVVLPVTTDGKVIAIRQFRPPINGFNLELPGGNVKPYYSPCLTAIDELIEETGYECFSFTRLKSGCWLDPGSLRVSFIPYLALGCTKVREPNHEREEFITVELFSMKKWLDILYDEKGIVDSRASTVTFLALPHLRKLGLIE